MRIAVVVVVLIVLGLILFGIGVIAAIGILITALEAAAILAAVGLVVLGVGLVLDWLRAGPAACGLVTRVVFKDTCEGPCPPGQICTVTATRPYGPYGWFGVQASACACAPFGPGGGPGGGGGPGTGPGGGGTGSGQDEEDG